APISRPDVRGRTVDETTFAAGTGRCGRRGVVTMTSRTTKQAAREYQKAHGVPYTEALRRVIGGQAPGEADAGVGASSKRTVWLDPLSEHVESLDRRTGVDVEMVGRSGPA